MDWPGPLPLLHDELDFYVGDHNHQQQEEKML
jgi:hypothetical protein